MTTKDRMPPSSRMGRERPTEMSNVLFTYASWLKGDDLYPTQAKKRVLGFGVPDWQRRVVWTDEQCVRFINSIWQGICIGFWMLNVLDDVESPLDGLVVDGLQRLTAIQRYVDNEYPVASANGEPLFWNDLTNLERRRFGKTLFPYIEISVSDETELKKIYDLYNFGGTPHHESERALNKP